MKLSEVYTKCKEAGQEAIAAGRIKCSYLVLNDSTGKQIFVLNSRNTHIDKVEVVTEERNVIRNGVITKETYTVEVPYVETSETGLGQRVCCYTVGVPNEAGLVQVVISGAAATHMRNVVALAEAQGKTIGEAYRAILDGTAEIYVRPNAVEWQPVTEEEIEHGVTTEDAEDPETPAVKTDKKKWLLAAVAALVLLNH